jgi:hypothetical protein
MGKTANRFNISQYGSQSAKKGFQNKRIQFYNTKREMMGSRYSGVNARSKDEFEGHVRNASTAHAITPGFFNSRTVRNNSLAPATGVMSKTFENYVRARERAEAVAKDKIDHLNK